MGRRLSVAAPLAAVALVMTASTGGATAPDPATATALEPGSYVMLLDRAGAIRVLQYRIGDGAVIEFRLPPIQLSADINTILVTDRGFLPTRIVHSYYLSGYRIDYRDPPTPATEGMITIDVDVYRSGFTQPPELIDRYAANFSWLGSEARAFSAGTLVGYNYETDFDVGIDENEAPRTQTGTVRRVYVPALDLDVDAKTWANAGDIRIGRVTSSIELGPITWLMSEIPIPIRECISGVVALPEYLAYSAEIAALERRTLGLIDRAWTDVLEYGLADYDDVAKRYGIAEKFRGCTSM